MKWTVAWVPIAEQKLARLWLRALDRAAVSRAAFEIDRLLKSDPETVGESRVADQRIAHEPPLGLLFKVSPADRFVQVLDVWWYGKRARNDNP